MSLSWFSFSMIQLFFKYQRLVSGQTNFSRNLQVIFLALQHIRQCCFFFIFHIGNVEVLLKFSSCVAKFSPWLNGNHRADFLLNTNQFTICSSCISITYSLISNSFVDVPLNCNQFIIAQSIISYNKQNKFFILI